jgi:hypothetical protein
MTIAAALERAGIAFLPDSLSHQDGVALRVEADSPNQA